MKTLDELRAEAQRIKFKGGVSIELTFDEFVALDDADKIVSVIHPASFGPMRTANYFEQLRVVPVE